MKIPGSDDSSKNKISSLVAREAGKNAELDSKLQAKTKNIKGLSVDGDSVKLSSLSKEIASELDPAKIKADRAAFVKNIKAQVDGGNYKVSSDTLARAFISEIFTESALAESQKENQDEQLF